MNFMRQIKWKLPVSIIWGVLVLNILHESVYVNVGNVSNVKVLKKSGYFLQLTDVLHREPPRSVPSRCSYLRCRLFFFYCLQLLSNAKTGKTGSISLSYGASCGDHAVLEIRLETRHWFSHRWSEGGRRLVFALHNKSDGARNLTLLGEKHLYNTHTYTHTHTAKYIYVYLASNWRQRFLQK